MGYHRQPPTAASAPRAAAALILAALACAAVALPAPARAASIPAGSTVAISGTPDLLGLLATPVADSSVGAQGASRDGRFVAFTSAADGLSPDDDDGVTNVYVKDTATGAVTLASRADGAAGEPAHQDCSDAALSANGARVAFVCDGPLAPADANAHEDVYLRDLGTGRTDLVSRATGLGATGDSSSLEPAIDATGSHVAFASFASNLTPVALPGSKRVYRRELLNGGTTVLVSRATGAAGAVPPDDRSEDPSISGDGARVAFTTEGGAQLDPADTNGRDDVYVRDVSAAQTVLVSRADGAGQVGNGDSGDAAISGNGQFVAFTSRSTQFDNANDPTPDPDAYRRSLTSGATQLLSITAAGAKADGAATVASIDDSGETVAFRTAATNLDPADATAARTDIYVRRGNEMLLASRADGAGGAPVNGVEITASVSGDGSRVVFGAQTALVGGLEPRAIVVAARDLTPGSTIAVSRPPGAAPFLNAGGSASGGSASADGRFVAFSSDARGLGAPASAGMSVFVRDTVTGAAVLASREDGPDGAPLGGESVQAHLSADGRRVAFVTFDRDGGTRIFVRDLAAGQTVRVDRADGAGGAPANGFSSTPTISDDGARVAFESAATNLGDGDTDAATDVHVRVLADGQTLLASRADGAAGAKGNAGSTEPVLSGDGRSVAFVSRATNLGDGDSDALGDVHVRRLDTGTTRLVSALPAGIAGDIKANGGSNRPSISRTGTRIAFSSGASNLGETSFQPKLFVRDLAAGTLEIAGRRDGAGGAPFVGSVSPGVLSADGGTLAFAFAEPTLIVNGARVRGLASVFVRDLAAGATRLVSRRLGSGEPAGNDLNPAVTSVTADGACAVFTTPGRMAAAPASPDFTQTYLHALRADCGRAGGTLPPPPAVRDRTAPRLSGVRLSRSRFRVGSRATALTAAVAAGPAGSTAAEGSAQSAAAARPAGRGTVLALRVSERARLTVTVQRQRFGRRVRSGRRWACRIATRRPKRGACTAWSRDGTLTRPLRAGPARIAFTGRLGRRPLAPGVHRLVLVARDAAGNASRPVTVRFTVLR